MQTTQCIYSLASSWHSFTYALLRLQMHSCSVIWSIVCNNLITWNGMILNRLICCSQIQMMIQTNKITFQPTIWNMHNCIVYRKEEKVQPIYRIEKLVYCSTIADYTYLGNVKSKQLGETSAVQIISKKINFYLLSSVLVIAFIRIYSFFKKESICLPIVNFDHGYNLVSIIINILSLHDIVNQPAVIYSRAFIHY